MKHLMWALGLFAIIALTATAHAASAVPKRFVGAYAGTYQRASLSQIHIQVSASGVMDFRIHNPDDGPGVVFTDTYHGTVAEDGTFEFTNTLDQNIKFKGRFVGNRLQGRTSLLGEHGGVVNAKRRP